jgi:hypothetical protein
VPVPLSGRKGSTRIDDQQCGSSRLGGGAHCRRSGRRRPPTYSFLEAQGGILLPLGFATILRSGVTRFFINPFSLSGLCNSMSTSRELILKRRCRLVRLQCRPAAHALTLPPPTPLRRSVFHVVVNCVLVVAWFNHPCDHGRGKLGYMSSTVSDRYRCVHILRR